MHRAQIARDRSAGRMAISERMMLQFRQLYAGWVKREWARFQESPLRALLVTSGQ